MGRITRWMGTLGLVCASGMVAPAVAQAQVAGEHPNLWPRITQDMVENQLDHRQVRREGRRIFSTPFNVLDGLGDGELDPNDKVSPGGRPTLGGNGMFLRMNGLDAQTCLECHSVLSTASIPARFAVGGAGNVSDSAFPGIIDPDVDDSENNGFAAIQGRMINPPFSFGSGGVELLGKEMTADLQALKAQAEANPGAAIDLVTKRVNFGTIVYENGSFDTSGVVGVDEDLVVRPFGRKGCCATIREFDVDAMPFHHGIQPVETVGEDVDADGDGVTNELLVGELSAMHVFQVSLERPEHRGRSARSFRGGMIFRRIGCEDCHKSYMFTESRVLTLSFPEVPTDPSANVYYEIDLSRRPTSFRRSGRGLIVPLYADLKRHDMGEDLAETTGDQLDSWFQTARLWGVADTAPYLHDGRAGTLTEAILWHGGEAQDSRDAFEALPDHKKRQLIAFLRTLRTPRDPNADIR